MVVHSVNSAICTRYDFHWVGGTMKGQGEAESLVFVVDDDASMRQAVTSLLQSVDLRVEAFGSAADFLKKGRIANGITAACLILDISITRRQRARFSGRTCKGRHSFANHFHQRTRRHPDDGARHEGGRDRIPNQAIPRSRSSRCRSARGSGSDGH